MTKNKWGQNFLNNQNIVKSIINVADIEIGESILEIGPGLGVLTKALLEKDSFVTAIEIDTNLCKYLKERFKDEKKFTLLEMDVMELSSSSLSQLIPKPSKIVANLPYNISTQLFLRIFPVRKAWESLTLMLQKEVAERICASPESRKAYGALSLVCELGFKREIIEIIPPECFKPSPKVDSAIVRLLPKDSELNPEREKLFLQWIQLLFQQRRKTLVNGIRKHYPEWYLNQGFTIQKKFGMRRPETLWFKDWMRLFNNFLKNQNDTYKRI